MSKNAVDEGPGHTTVPPIQLPQATEIIQKLDALTELVIHLQESVDLLLAQSGSDGS